MSHAAALLTLLLATLAVWGLAAVSIGALWAYQRRRQLGDLDGLQARAGLRLATDSGGTSR
jgi:hypothetical protein